MDWQFKSAPVESNVALPDMSGRCVLQLIPELQSGGAERGTIEVARAIIEAGGRALVACAPGGRLIPELEKVGAEYFPVAVGKKSIMGARANARRIAEIVSAEKVDLIHARSRVPAWVAKMASKKTGVPYIATWHGLHDGGSIKKRYNKALVEGERVIAISEFIAEKIRKDYGIGDDRLRIIPRGVDLDWFRPEAVLGGRIIALSEKWKVPDGEPVILMPGRLTEWKGQELFIEAVARLRAAMPDFLFAAVILGDAQGRDAYRDALEKKIQKLGLWDVMRLADHTTDMAAAYKLADIVVVPSIKPEPFGRVPIEAQAVGSMVVAANHGGLSETVIDGETGFLFKPGDVDGFAAALQSALTIDDDERERRAQVACERVHRDYDMRLMCKRTLDVYREILTQDGAARLT